MTLPRDRDGHQYGTAQQLAALLTSPGRPITAGRVRDWARRSRNPKDRLYGMLPTINIPGPRTGLSYHRLDHAAAVEAATRRSSCTLQSHTGDSRRPMPATR